MSLPRVFLHGWGQHPAVWQTLLAALPAPPQDALCLPLPGYAGSRGTPDDYTLAVLVEHLAEQAPARCHVIGWSLGAQIALAWAQARPAQAASLTLISATPCFGRRPDWPHGADVETQSAFAAQIAENPLAGLQRFAELMLMGETDPRPARRRLRALLAEPLPAADILQAGLALLAATDLRPALQAAPPALPTLLVHGEGDTITPLAASQWLAQHLPSAQHLRLPACGHAPLLSHADVLAAAMTRLFDDSE